MIRMQHSEKIKAAREFVDRWCGRGQEKSDTHTFWLDLCENVIGMESVQTTVLFESKTSERGWIDAVIPDAKTFIEQKSIDVDLDKPELRQNLLVTPFEQAKRYADSQRNSQRPDTIIVSNFKEFRIHDLDAELPGENYEWFRLEELPDQLHLLSFLTDPQAERARREKSVSLAAGSLIGKLHDMLRGQYQDPDSAESQHSLNVLLVRIVFCLYAEDSGLFGRNAFHDYLVDIQPRMVRHALSNLFDWLDTPVADRDPYEAEDYAPFPFVNGGLFRERDTEIPNFTREILDVLVNEVSAGTDWSQISPTIFGGVFESTLNPETRHAGGMHYTSPENLHRVVDPLFLDDLTEELDGIINERGVGTVKRRNNLKRYQKKLAGLQFFDPACGSGNFLTETYISMRRLENKVLSELAQHQTSLVFEDVEETPVKVNVNQFYGLEINDFAVSVAQTALWIAKVQADLETEIIISGGINVLPLTDSPNIVHGNALRTDWTTVLDPTACDYLIGNPPFLSGKLSQAQKADRGRILGKAGGSLDYVACWYKLAAEYMKNTQIEAALVSTNSICQGTQVKPLWEPLFDAGIIINFAHRTFVWRTDSADPAAVHVIIVGFGYTNRSDKKLFTYEVDELIRTTDAKRINAYLVDANDYFIGLPRKSVDPHAPLMMAGGKPTDGKNLIMSEDEMKELVAKDPAAQNWIRRYSMGEEFIDGTERYCLWMPEIEPHELKSMPVVEQRVLKVKEFRENSDKAATRKKAEIPWRFDEVKYNGEGDYLAVPKVSSGRRRYVPIGFIEDGMIPGDSLYFVPDATPFHFAIITSRVHMAWLRVVGGRWKSDYRYANTLVYNNFVWPTLPSDKAQELYQSGLEVIEARRPYMDKGATLEDLYDPDNDWLYPDLTTAHENLDAAVERAYGLTPGCDEKEIVELLFQLYGQAVGAE